MVVGPSFVHPVTLFFLNQAFRHLLVPGFGLYLLPFCMLLNFLNASL